MAQILNFIVTKDWIFFLRLPSTPSAVESSTFLKLFAMVSTLLSKTQMAENFPTLGWITSAVFGSKFLQVISGAGARWKRSFQLDGSKHEVMITAKTALDWAENRN